LSISGGARRDVPTRSDEATDTLPAFCRARVLILGVGNILFGDDGFGPEAVAHLKESYELPNDVYAMDVGTGVRKLLFTLSLSEQLPEEIFILDAVDGGRGDWQVGEIPLEALPSSKADDFSLHQLPSSNLLRELQDERGVKVTVVACDVGAVPQVIQAGLSTAAREGVVAAARHLAQRLGLKGKSDGSAS
jgi:coenzyme F420 hydrogenase subunit delta